MLQQEPGAIPHYKLTHCDQMTIQVLLDHVPTNTQDIANCELPGDVIEPMVLLIIRPKN